ncbi:MAG: FAD-dependent oxidoreductase [Lachnospiraceae bacterium]|nr:FAD-dependent oxidoreductase [Lachnospiraceae bacterium]
MEHITIREHQIPVVKNVDVFIAGGGPAGVGAAIQAARSGADVLLAERLFCLGGTMTAGLMSKVAMSACNYGLAHEIITRMDAYQGTHYLDSRPEVPVDPETGKIILEQMVIDEEHVDVRYGTVVSGVVTNGREIEAVVLSNLDGEIAVRAKYYIDCTGDGQMAFLAGAECMTEQGESYSSSPTLMFRIGNVDLEKMFRYEEENPELFVREYNTYKRHLMTGTECRENIRNQIYAHMADFVRLIRLRCSEHRDEFSEEDEEILLRRGILFLSQPYPNHVLVNSTTNPAWRGDSNVELSASMAEMRKHCHLIHRFAKRFIPGFEESFLMDTASMMGIRESRRIRGEYVLTQEDIESFKKHDDAVCSNSGGVEIHSGKKNSLLLRELDGVEGYDIPFRALYAKDFTNLLMAGRCFSATHPALSAARNISYCCALGQAAGAAAAELSGSGKKDVRDVDIRYVQEVCRANLATMDNTEYVKKYFSEET